jgi:hypothetical protein
LIFERTFERVELFNLDVETLLPSCKGIHEALHPWSTQYPSLRTLDHWAMRADCLALHFQKQTRRARERLYVLAFIAFLSFEVQAHLLPRTPQLLLLYPAVALGAYAFLGRTRRKQIEQRYLDYRSVAEALRVQFYWTMAGLKTSVADFYLFRQRSELDWLRVFVRYARLLAPDLPASGLEKRLGQVRELWVAGQLKFFANRLETMKGQLRRTKRITKGLVCLAITVATVMGTFGALFHFTSVLQTAGVCVEERRWIHGVAILLIGLPSIIAGLLHGYAEGEGLKEHARQAREMIFLYVRGDEALTASVANNDISKAQRIVFELGKEALGENAEWLILHRERPLSVPE